MGDAWEGRRDRLEYRSEGKEKRHWERKLLFGRALRTTERTAGGRARKKNRHRAKKKLWRKAPTEEWGAEDGIGGGKEGTKEGGRSQRKRRLTWGL